jgi:GAF domain-containing protein
MGRDPIMVTAADRLQLLYDLAREVATFTDLDSVLRYATRRTREVLGAEGCSVLLLDDSRRMLYFPVASQAESSAASAASLEQASFPADKGIAGWVLQHDQAAQVDDTANDPRFYAGIDRQVGSTTRALLCAPLRSRSGNIGVVEVVNPLRGRFAADDLAILEAMAADIAVACEKARLYDVLRHETFTLRQACMVAGLGLLVLAGLFVVGGAYAHLARALPLAELPRRSVVLTGVLLLAAGVALVAVARGWLISRTRPTMTPPRQGGP